LWHVFMPIITRFAGFFPGKALGLSENLPFEVASEWASRRFAADVRSDLDVGKFVHIRSDALIVRPTDDPFATETAAWRIRTHFPNTHFSELAIETPNRTKIGHFGFFGRRSRETLWPLALKWFIQR
jgi:predicted alpha/beta hydrolase